MVVVIAGVIIAVAATFILWIEHLQAERDRNRIVTRKWRPLGED